MGGKIAVESELGRGSRFCVHRRFKRRWPRAQRRPARAAAAPAARAARRQPTRSARTSCRDISPVERRSTAISTTIEAAETAARQRRPPASAVRCRHLDVKGLGRDGARLAARSATRQPHQRDRDRSCLSASTATWRTAASKQSALSRSCQSRCIPPSCSTRLVADRIRRASDRGVALLSSRRQDAVPRGRLRRPHPRRRGQRDQSGGRDRHPRGDGLPRRHRAERPRRRAAVRRRRNST